MEAAATLIRGRIEDQTATSLFKNRLGSSKIIVRCPRHEIFSNQPIKLE
jgi:hypothetical protein